MRNRQILLPSLAACTAAFALTSTQSSAAREVCPDHDLGVDFRSFPAAEEVAPQDLAQLWVYASAAVVTVTLDDVQLEKTETVASPWYGDTWHAFATGDLALGDHTFLVRLERPLPETEPVEFGPVTFRVGNDPARTPKVPAAKTVFEPYDGDFDEWCTPFESLDLLAPCTDHFMRQDCFDSGHLYMRLDIQPDDAVAFYATGDVGVPGAYYGFWPDCPVRHHAQAHNLCSTPVCTQLRVYSRNGLLAGTYEVCGGGSPDDPDDSDDTGDTGDTETGESETETGDSETGATGDSSHGEDPSVGGSSDGQSSAGDEPNNQPDNDGTKKGCGCATATSDGGVLAPMWLIVLAVARRRLDRYCRPAANAAGRR